MTLSPQNKFAATAAAISLFAGTALVGLAPAPAATEEKATGVSVIIATATNACFSDRVRVAGFLVPQTEAVATVDSEGFKITEVLAAEGDQVKAGQALARLTRPAMGNAPAASETLQAPVAGVVTRRTTMIGTMASPQAEPLFRIMVDGKIELEAEVPSAHIPKLKAGATARVAIESGPELNGRVRMVAGEIDRRGQLGRVRLSLDDDPTLRIGMFAHATIDASRSCGVSIPRAAVIYKTDGTSVQVVRDGKVETRVVKVGLQSDTSVEIRQGVSQGDAVVANAGTSLRDGDAVKTILADETEQVRVK